MNSPIYKILRGGSWGNLHINCRTFVGTHQVPKVSRFYYGLRLMERRASAENEDEIV